MILINTLPISIIILIKPMLKNKKKEMKNIKY